MSTNPKEPRWRIKPDVLEQIKYQAKEASYSPHQILSILEEEFGTEQIPSEKTIGRILGFHRPSNLTPWVPTAMPGEDAALVLKSLATTEMGMGLRNAGWPTNQEAARILWVRKAAPTLPAIAARMFARYYLVYEDDPENRQILDWMITYRIWTSKAAWDEYRRMVDHRDIPGVEENARIYHCIAFEYMRSYVQEDEKSGL